MSEKWKLVTGDQMVLRDYACGVSAGMQVLLRRDLAIQQGGLPTGTVYPAGEIWHVLTGNPAQPNVVWLRQPNGEQHTWDTESFLEWFEPIGPGA